MKKLIAFVLVLALSVTLMACGSTTESNDPSETTAPVNNEETPTEGQQATETYSYTLEDFALVPGAPFDPAQLREATSVYEVPSCAIEGTDNVYNYDTVEVTAFDDGTGEIIYSIYIVDANTPTDEGLYIGDTQQQVDEIYGTDCTVNGNELTYQKGNTLLIVIVENDTVTSIEYRAVVEA